MKAGKNMNVFIQELEFDPNHPYTITIIYFTSNIKIYVL